MNRLSALVVCTAFAWGVPTSGAEAQRELTWSAGQPVAASYLQAERIARLVRSEDPALDFRAEAGTAYDNMTRLQRGQATLAWGPPPLIVAASSGTAPYSSPHADLRLVMTGLGYVDTLFCVPGGSAPHSIREIFDKKMSIRIGVGRAGSVDEWELRKIFEFYKTTFSEFQRRGGRLVYGSVNELLDEYRSGSLDAVILTSAVPAAEMQKAALAHKIRILSMDDDLLSYLESFGMAQTIFEEGRYNVFVDNDIGSPTAAMANTIVTSAKVSEGVIHDFTKVLLDNVDALRAADPAFSQFNPSDAMKMASVPLHPGAQRAYREAGFIK